MAFESRRKGVITYRLFSEMTKGEQQEILAIAIEKKRVVVRKGVTIGYRLPISEEDYFVPSEDDLLVAKRGNKLLGSAMFHIELQATHAGRGLFRVVSLDRLFVIPEHREKGIGTKLFMRLKLLAEEKWKIPLRESSSFARLVMRMNEKVKKRAHGKFAPWRRPR